MTARSASARIASVRLSSSPAAVRTLAGALLWAVSCAPPVRQALEASMTAQALVQIPLLVAAGWLVAAALPYRARAAIARWNGGGVSGLLLASLVGMLWMLPRMMDASLDDGRFALAKLVSVPLGIGMPLALSWPRAGFVVRGVFLLELVATAFRLGWLYLVSPVRLCTRYLASDQQRLGESLLAIGTAACLLLAWKLVWGRVRVEPGAL